MLEKKNCKRNTELDKKFSLLTIGVMTGRKEQEHVEIISVISIAATL